ncbi:hypothetical protein COV15_01560 [Candidatus Woesearchaeota archaeon CG10_big_fil_rev_8_21_14_0_10_34_12]|nr:MAG: hypothetical protein COV15_01560 [Candidatus Woesearchaeota archaeon CG10_big_fil_rev_8_21_14_0_10_34_12]
MKTKFSSFCLNGISSGCKYCVKGRKLVLFISGKCSRNCSYCSLSEKRKNKDTIWANERECRNIKEVIKEARESRATSAGITGGDPLLFLSRTLKFAEELKKTFGKNFHIHIYLPTKLVTKEKLKKLSKYIDGVRFHPGFLANKLNEKQIREEITKIKLAKLFWDKKNIGIELPMIPDKKKEIFAFIKQVKPFISFVNLNEFEISDTNFNYIIKHYKLNSDTYTIKNSVQAGLWIIKQCKKSRLNLKIHLCTAKTKNFFQYQNRLKLHTTLPYGFRTQEGLVKYFAIYAKNNKELNKIFKEIKKLKHLYIDASKNRIILSEKTTRKLLGKYKITRVEEFPTYDGIEVESEVL